VDEEKSGSGRAEVTSVKPGESFLQEGRAEMGFDEGLCLFLDVLIIIGIIVVIADYRRGKRSLAMTAGLILLGLGIAADMPLPTVMPSLANVPIRPSIIITLGLLIILVSMFVELKRKKNKSS
jgi:hypothetical protein